MNNKLILWVAAVGFLFSLGCASKVQKPQSTVFFPPAPELPRVQFLTSFAGLKDVEEQSAFNKFVVGEKENLRLDKPYGVAIYEGKIYVCDTNDTVVVLDIAKKSYSALKGSVSGQGKLVQPVNIYIDNDGTKYVADPVRGQIVVYDRNDEYLRAYGIPGSWKPVDAVPFEDRLYVVDNANSAIKVFSRSTGEIIKTIGDKGEENQRLYRPTNLSFDPQGYLYVTDISRFQVVKYDRDGHFITAYGKIGDNWGHFARPKGIAIDREGQIYVADAAFNNVQIFNPQGRLLLFFGEGGPDPGQFILPAKVVIDYKNIPYFQKFARPDFQIEYLILVTSQLGERSVSVLAYGKQKGKKYPTNEELLNVIEQKKKRELEKQQKS